jgi:tetratricopeptide (TPR) repeat protein
MMLQDALAWTALGDVHHAMSSLEDAVEAYGRAVATHNMAAPPEVPALKTLVRLGGLFLQLSKVDAAKDIFLQGAGAWQCCSMWLGAGIALLRLERFGDSEAALQEANVRNNENPVVWGYICLLCLAVGEARLEQANKAQAVASRLGLKDPTLLRELANAYTEIDRLETAEALFRRSLAVDETSSHTRRRLADVLSAQNAYVDAVNEYLKVVDAFKKGGGAADKAECLAAIAQCEKLLKSLGRADEIKPLLELQQTIA